VRILKSKLFLLFFGAFVSLLLLRVYVYEVYRIPSCSMMSTLYEGDYIVVSKIAYGPRVVNVWKLIFRKQLEYNWYSGIHVPRKGDVIVFNFPQYNVQPLKYPNLLGVPFVKRCYGLPGDTVLIGKANGIHMLRKEGILCTPLNKNSLVNTRELSLQPNLFPFDSTLSWTLDNYGPLLVPGKGITIPLTTKTVNHYKDILILEGNDISFQGDSVFLNGLPVNNYEFKEDYFFVLGDNFYGSRDSRYWGFVPRRCVIGKVVFVLFSLDNNKKWYNAVRWDRLMKLIN
jgi:signal peptidase I